MSTATRLDPILESVRARAAERRRVEGLDELRRGVEPVPERRARFVAALRRPGLSIIAECKRRSPSVGALSAEVALEERVQDYARGGADALSILTERDHFDGHPRDLRAAAVAGLPRLRKDFVLDEGMVLESVAMGAEAVLLLAVCLPGERMGALRRLAGELGLATLVEVHDARELERALAVEPDCVGVNARDLTTFEVRREIFSELLPRIPKRFVRVAESGIGGLEHLHLARRVGADAVLVGEALMRAEDPAGTLREWVEATR